MKKMCLPCYGTGQIKCLRCGGSGVWSNSSLLDKDCLKCKGTRQQPCLLCRGSGFVGGDVTAVREISVLTKGADLCHTGNC